MTLVALCIGLLTAGAPLASAAYVPSNVCSNNNTYAAWSSKVEYAYLSYAGSTAPPTFCFVNPVAKNRLVYQENGDLVVWSGVHTGGKVLWHSKSGNKGATQLRFQSDGNVFVYKGYPGGTPLWSSGTWQCGGGWIMETTAHQLLVTNNYACKGVYSPSQLTTVVAQW